MPFGINIRCDNDSAAPIRSRWQEMAVFEDRPSMAGMNFPPHVTFAVYEDGTDAELLFAAAARAFGDEPAVSLEFRHLRYFENTPLVLWAEPSPSPTLTRLHESIHASVPQSLCRPKSRPGEWRAHCTLAFRVREDCRQEAMARCAVPIEPFSVTFDVGDVASFPPARTLKAWPLSNSETARN